MTRRVFVPVLLALALAACGTKASDSKRYPMKGEIKALDPGSKTATIDAGDIGDWMKAMTMEFPVKPDSELAKLHVGDRIEATVVVTENAYYVTDIKVIPRQ